MRRYEMLAERILGDLEAHHLGPLVGSLKDSDLVALLAGTSGTADEHRYVRDIVATELNNRLVGKSALLEEAVLPTGSLDIARFTEAISRALRVDMACVDEVEGPYFLLYGKHQVPPELEKVEKCRQSSMALCERVLRTEESLVVADIPGHPELNEVPAWQKFGIRFYAGAPGFNPEGYVQSILWVASYESRILEDEELFIIERMSDRIAAEFYSLNGARPAALSGTLPARPLGP